ncbi:MAG: YqeG family HAD IIIA-type phosphatase [Clostridia bacterium]|nr:YqeG family HAD IIIA-type phosphatase [Clostridia bacterium]
MNLFTPDLRKERVTEITPEVLRALGVKGVIVDLDNTLGGYDDPLPPPDVIEWAKGIAAAGFPLGIVSNNSHKKRVSAYAAALGVPWKRWALKPLAFKLRSAAREMGLKRREVCKVGDKVWNDVVGARLAHMKVILVTSVAKLKQREKEE